MSELEELSKQLNSIPIDRNLRLLSSRYPDKIVFTTSFGLEDQVITHLIFSNDIPIKVVTLDTGRLFPETYKVFADTTVKYRKKINVYFPDSEEVEGMVTAKGPYSFYESKENRFECCHIRKVVPLNRALEGNSVWITGIRSDQSGNRGNMSDVEYDHQRQMIKYHPLFGWTFEMVESFIKEHEVPYNSLHDKGYPSIGCEPCTRPVEEGQDFRAGRWWWENDGSKECGCHIKIPAGREAVSNES